VVEVGVDETDRELGEARWDLEPLLAGDPSIDAEQRLRQLLDEAAARAHDVAVAYRGRVAAMDGDGLSRLMKELGAVRELAARAETFASLRWSVNTADHGLAAARQSAQERVTELDVELLFFESQWAAVSDERAEALLEETRENPAVPSHYLRRLRDRRAHMLSNAEERVLAAVSVSSRDAWKRQYTELGAAVRVTLDGKQMSVDAAVAELQDPDRDARRAVGTALASSLASSMPAKAFVFNTLLLEKSVDDQLRDYPHWLASRNLENETSDESVRALTDAVTHAAWIARRWYTLKAELLGIERLADYDRFAPLRPADASVSYGQARAVVIEAFGDFSPHAGAIVRQAFEESWIDAPPDESKTGGAFCHDGVPSVHPYVLLNFTGTRSDVLYMAHELGHALHAALARPRGVFELEPVIVTAETASIFGETLAFERMLADADQPGQLDLLAWRLDNTVRTLFEAIAIHGFEQRVHTHRRIHGELSADEFSHLWLQSQAEIYGDSFETTFNQVNWAYYPHMALEPGYVYAYAYGHLLSLSAYARYREIGPDFAPDLLSMLAGGSSKPPHELAAIIGFDLTDPRFWDAGLDLVAEQLHLAESLAAGYLRE
jgi:oligoendopeptidase F